MREDDTHLPDSIPTLSGKMDARARRTRTAILHAFNSLVLNRRKRHIRVSDLIDEAKVGRSTFYEHFGSADAVHLEALKRPLGPLADAAAGRGEELALTHILKHFWEYRDRARRTFDQRSERLLAELVAERLGAEPLLLPHPLAARHLSASAHAIIVAWLKAEAPATPDELAAAICRAGRAQLKALRSP